VGNKKAFATILSPETIQLLKVEAARSGRKINELLDEIIRVHLTPMNNLCVPVFPSSVTSQEEVEDSILEATEDVLRKREGGC
jgi:hypothetical protein